MFTPKSVAILPDGRLLVSGVDENDRMANAPLIEAPELSKQLNETPQTIPNPAYAPLEAQAFALAQKAIEEQHAIMDRPAAGPVDAVPEAAEP